MPYRVVAFWHVIGAVWTLEVSSSLLLLAQAGHASVFDDGRLIALCMIGSVGGAISSLVFFAPNQPSEINNLRMLLAKIACSFFCGVSLAPIVLDRLGQATNANYAISVSFAFAAVSVAAIHAAVPIVSVWWKAWLKSRLPKIDKEGDK